jgi:hypothetical protein
MANGKNPDLTPLFILMLILIIAGLGSIRSCELYKLPSKDSGPGGPPGKNGKYEYTVVAGSFNNAEDARRLAAQLRAARINNFIVQREGKWLVCVGKYWTEARAVERAEFLKTHGVPNAKVLPSK